MDDAVDDLLAYIDAAPTPWHAVAETARRLEAVGYRALDESEAWDLGPTDRAYVVRGGTSIAAFEIGRDPPSAAGFRLVGAHTDSPNLRVKPKGLVTSEGSHQLAVEPYGGVLLHTWLDRDLSLAGRVMLRDGDALRSQRVRFQRPLGRVPSLAIHLDRTVNEEGLKLNAQTHMPPILALELGGPLSLEWLLAEELGVEERAVVAYDLCLYDVVPPARGGARGELIFAPRLDNLASCHAGLRALLAAAGERPATRGVVLYDHEECGSRSPQGADSPFLAEVLARLVSVLEPGGGAQAHARALSRSFLVSADMAHAIHPNYGSKHEPGHAPRLGAGPVIKTNVNQRYATDGESAARFARWCERADVPVQHFVTRSDLACGSTIGPISAGRLGVRTVDVGNPMLSMHSCREMAGAGDVAPMIAALAMFFERSD